MEDTLLIEKLQVANALTARLGTILSIKSLTRELAQAAREITQCERAAILLVDSERATFSIGAVDAIDMPSFSRNAVSYNPAEPAFAAWLRGESYLAHDITAESSLSTLMQTLEIDSFYSLPLLIAEAPAGVIIVANQSTHPPLDIERVELLDSVQTSAEIAFANATLYSQTVAELDARMQELEMMRQIDRELSDTIQLERVFDLTLDWALRYTVAQGASLALYSSETDELRFVADLGYSVDPNIPTLNSSYGGIALRVARSGEPAMVADVLADPDYIPISSTIRSHMSVPLLRDDVVVAVITLESRRLNAFTEDHLQFVDKLAARAGVAIDNARLYSESVREREKLSHILSEIADIVVVVGIDDRMILINQSGIAALGQNTEATDATSTYIGKRFDEALAGTPLLPLFQSAMTSGQMMVDEVQLNGDRTYYAEFSPQAEIGWIIVMHDITPLKETDELKSELVATVSHDLKQPLSVMNGYLELLQMSHHLDTRGENFVRMIARSIDHMRHLIDDVLDLAKIESGIALQIEPVQIEKLILECTENVSALAENKSIQIASDLAPNLPKIAGDPNRLRQIFSNLIGNAVKYTQRGGSVHVMIEALDHNLRFTVRDNGMGISPEEQARIFDRFYRVRRPETENIEGTGLGLAIVKKLIEAHKGTIGVESSVGEGTAFYVTLPIYEQ